MAALNEDAYVCLATAVLRSAQLTGEEPLMICI